jgi:hypothetical protein
MRRSAVVGVFALALTAPLAGQHRAAVEVIGFGDFNFFVTQRPGVLRGFRSGQLAGHVGAEVTSRLSVFAEVTATPVANAPFNLEIERTILRYDFSDRLKLSAGRYHTPISYWNTAFHHGQWLQTTTARPEMIKFGGTFLPVHFVGILAEGAVVAGLRYHVGLGNGRGSPLSRGGDAGDVNKQRAWLAGLTLTPGGLRALQVGGAFYSDRAQVAPGPVDERTVTAHVVWTKEHPEFIAEYAHARHEISGGASATSEAGYVQLAYRLPGPADVLKPYARWERVHVPTSDPLLGAASPTLNYTAVIAGLRYDFAPVAALKAEYRREKIGTPQWYDTLVLQASFTFPRWEEERAGEEVSP